MKEKTKTMTTGMDIVLAVCLFGALGFFYLDLPGCGLVVVALVMIFLLVRSGHAVGG
jgi:hypothetical protein